MTESQQLTVLSMTIHSIQEHQKGEMNRTVDLFGILLHYIRGHSKSTFAKFWANLTPPSPQSEHTF